MSATQIRGNTQIMAASVQNAQIGINADFDVTTHKIVNVVNPTGPQDAATKLYVDNTAQGLSTKASVRVISLANITLSGTQTIDGVALSAGNTVLVAAQTLGQNNGSYVVQAGAWVRTTDFDAANDAVAGAYWFVSEGTANASSGWILATPAPYTIGTTPLTFTQFSGAGEIIAGNGLTKSGNTLSINTAVTVDLNTGQTLTNKSIVATQLTGTLQAAQFPALTGPVTTSAGSLATTIANSAVTLAMLANLAANSVIGNSTGSAATPTAVPMVSTATASSVMFRDANANVTVNNLIEGMRTTATATATTTLIASDKWLQQFTGTLTQTVVMPDATTMAVGQSFWISNRSTGVVTVNANGGGLLQTMAAGSQVLLTVITNGVAAGTWDVAYSTSTAGAGSVTTVSVVSANGFAGTVATATTTPAITISTTVTGVIKGNGTAISAATLGTDFTRNSCFITRETPTGAVNGVNTTYTLANTPVVGTEEVFLNGILQEPGAGNDYTISGLTITYLTAPATNDRLRVCYMANI